MLEIEVSNILYNPGNIGKLTFSIFSYSRNIENLLFLLSHVLEMQAAGGRLQGLGSGGLGFLFGPCSWNFVKCPISRSSTFPWFWFQFALYLPLFVPYLVWLSFILPYWALFCLIWPWQLNKSVTQKVPTEDTEWLVCRGAPCPSSKGMGDWPAHTWAFYCNQKKPCLDKGFVHMVKRSYCEWPLA